MGKMSTLPFGGFVGGTDNYHAADDRVFDTVSTNEGINPPRRCQLSTNIVFNDEGLPELRPGSVQRITATDGLAAFSALGMLFYQDQGVIKRVTGTSPYATTDVVTGLNASAVVEFHEHAGEIYWTNGLVNGRIKSDGTAAPWGLTVPPAPTLGTTVGDLPAGRYFVCCVLEDADGIEHATGEASLITLADDSTDITVDLSAVDTDASIVRIFVTRTDGDTLYFSTSVAPGSLPATITNVRASSEQIKTQFLSPPIPGDGAFSYNGQIITFNGEYLYPSLGEHAHVFEIDLTEESRLSDLKAGAGLDGGYWAVTARGAFWTTGQPPDGLNTDKKDNRQYAKGSLVIPGSYLPSLGITDHVALFVSEDGLMVGRPDGVMQPVSDETQRLDVEGKTARIVYHKADDFNEIAFTLN